MPPSIAGAISTGQRAASSSVVRKSSAMPWAALASRFAVAGATTTACGALGEGDVLDRLGALRIEEVGEHRPAGERAEGEGAHEPLGVRGGAHRDRGAGRVELAQQVHRLVGGDATR